MPVFEIGLDDGRKLRIDAVDQEAALAGVQHFLGKDNQPKEGSVLDNARAGASGLLSGLGETASRNLGLDSVGNALKGAGAAVAPENQPPDTTLYDKQGFQVNYLGKDVNIEFTPPR